MVGGLVQAEHVPVSDEQPRQVDAAALPARERADLRLPRDVGNEAVQDVADACVAGPLVFGGVAHEGALHGVAVVQPVGLPQQAHAHRAVAHHAPLVGLERAGQKAEQGGFAIAVASDDADAVALVDAERHVVEHRLGGELHPHFFATEQKRHTIQPFP